MYIIYDEINMENWSINSLAANPDPQWGRMVHIKYADWQSDDRRNATWYVLSNVHQVKLAKLP